MASPYLLKKRLLVGALEVGAEDLEKEELLSLAVPAHDVCGGAGHLFVWLFGWLVTSYMMSDAGWGIGWDGSANQSTQRIRLDLIGFGSRSIKPFRAYMTHAQSIYIHKSSNSSIYNTRTQVLGRPLPPALYDAVRQQVPVDDRLQGHHPAASALDHLFFWGGGGGVWVVLVWIVIIAVKAPTCMQCRANQSRRPPIHPPRAFIPSLVVEH